LQSLTSAGFSPNNWILNTQTNQVYFDPNAFGGSYIDPSNFSLTKLPSHLTDLGESAFFSSNGQSFYGAPDGSATHGPTSDYTFSFDKSTYRMSDAEYAQSIADNFGSFGKFAKGSALTIGILSGGLLPTVANVSGVTGLSGVKIATWRNFSNSTYQAFERQLASGGQKSILKTQARILKNLQEHIEKLDKIKEVGGYSSSVEREIRTFQSQLSAIRALLK
jgi:hypothetical protein